MYNLDDYEIVEDIDDAGDDLGDMAMDQEPEEPPFRSLSAVLDKLPKSRPEIAFSLDFKRVSGDILRATEWVTTDPTAVPKTHCAP